MRSRLMYFYGSLLCAVFFFLTASLWTYLANVILALPALLISYWLWRAGKKHDPHLRRYRIIPILWLAGSVLSLGVLLALLSTN